MNDKLELGTVGRAGLYLVCMTLCLVAAPFIMLRRLLLAPLEAHHIIMRQFKERLK